MENPIKMDDLGVSLFLETSTCSPEENVPIEMPPTKGNPWETVPPESVPGVDETTVFLREKKTVGDLNGSW